MPTTTPSPTPFATSGVDTVTYPQVRTGPQQGHLARALSSTSRRPNGSIYFDYGTSFDPSAETLSLSAANSAVPPEQNETYELGSKWDVNNGSLTVRGALFRTNRENVLEPDPTNSSVDVLAGNQRVDGAEGVIQGRLTDRWEILSRATPSAQRSRVVELLPSVRRTAAPECPAEPLQPVDRVPSAARL